ncbi:MAG: methyltransferase domain-containing protein, partial [Clostridia bacterium]|nr:methyltransferase domain-containing protein [Clostridia bacterium]
LAKLLGLETKGTERFLHALCSLGLLTQDDKCYYNTNIAAECLVKHRAGYQGDSILWRRDLLPSWQNLKSCLQAGGRVVFASSDEDNQQFTERTRKYIGAMDRIAIAKVKEIMPFFGNVNLTGEIVDVGAGSGAVAAGFLAAFPETKALLIDSKRVLDYSQELMAERGLCERTAYCKTNILEPWPVEEKRFSLVIISNIVHAYAEAEISHVLAQAVLCLKEDGVILVHDFFREHCPEKATLFDLNMFINTYNGKVFNAQWVKERLAGLKLYATELIPLKTDTGIIIASSSEEKLASLCLNPITMLQSKMKKLGFTLAQPINTDNIHVPAWSDLRCRYGCDRYGSPHCPPNSPIPDKTRELLRDYRQALLLEGEPPTRDFQQLVLQAEKVAFEAGFYKAFSYWAGPCAICQSCSVTDGVSCAKPKNARPSMEGAGIDVFETVKRAGISLHPLSKDNPYVKYFGLLLLE